MSVEISYFLLTSEIVIIYHVLSVLLYYHMELTPCQEGKRKTAERSAVQIVEKGYCLIYFYYIIQFSLRRQATDSSFCRIALLGFAIRVGTPVNMNEGKNQNN